MGVLFLQCQQRHILHQQLITLLKQRLHAVVRDAMGQVTARCVKGRAGIGLRGKIMIVQHVIEADVVAFAMGKGIVINS